MVGLGQALPPARGGEDQRPRRDGGLRVRVRHRRRRGGAGLVDLHQSFLGKTAIFLTVAFCLTVRRLEDLDTLEVLADEATFYDKQWNETWSNFDRDSVKEN